jgi:hypothetical protein
MVSRLVIIVSALVLLLPLRAQRSGAPLLPGDPALYQVFFYFHDSVSSAIQHKKALDPVSGAETEKGFASKLRINPEELQKVTDVAHGFVTDLAKRQNDLKAYVDQVRSLKHQPDPAMLAQFDQRKRQLIDAAVHQVGTTLSPASWAGLHSYINDEHRLHTTRIEFRSSPVTPPGTARP